MSTATTTSTSHDTGQHTTSRSTTSPTNTPTTQLERPAAQRLRTTMAAVKLSFTWLGVRKTLAPEQRTTAARAFHADRKHLPSWHHGPPSVATTPGFSLLYLVSFKGGRVIVQNCKAGVTWDLLVARLKNIGIRRANGDGYHQPWFHYAVRARQVGYPGKDGWRKASQQKAATSSLPDGHVVAVAQPRG
jgi:hypothetical protein